MLNSRHIQFVATRPAVVTDNELRAQAVPASTD
jgi:hypothetical protein